MAYIKVMLLLGVSVLVASCASGSLLGKDPRCPFSEKGGCQSVKSINRMIDENKYIAGGDFVQNKEDILVCTTVIRTCLTSSGLWAGALMKSTNVFRIR